MNMLHKTHCNTQGGHEHFANKYNAESNVNVTECFKD